MIPVIAGFQGVDPENNITTLGRGGSDTSAVAIAAALKADDCEIYTDVDGVYTTDPRLCPEARKISRISYEEMMELASLGAKVLQIRSVELAAKYAMPIHVRSSFDPVEGTCVVSQEALMPRERTWSRSMVAGVAADVGQTKFTLQNIADGPGVAAQIFGALSSAADRRRRHRSGRAFERNADGELHRRQGRSSQGPAGARAAARERLSASMKIVEELSLAKVSIVGVGMQHHPGVASKMFALLAERGINIKLITTSEIKVSCLIEESLVKAAVECLHHGFGLDRVQ